MEIYWGFGIVFGLYSMTTIIQKQTLYGHIKKLHAAVLPAVVRQFICAAYAG